MLFKLLLIVLVLWYISRKVGGFFFRTLTGNQASQQQHRGSHQRPREGSIRVDHPSRSAQDKDYKGGEYVDFEEVE